MFTIEEIIQAASGVLIQGPIQGKVCAVSTDSRTLKTGELFIAVKGAQCDGHDWIEQALQRKAQAVMVTRQWAAQHTRELAVIRQPVIGVSDTVVALGRLAAFHRRRFAVPVIAVTGSNGKTTTKEMIAAVLSCRYNVLKNEASFNNHIGVPLTLLKLNSAHEVVVAEIGMNHKGEIRSLAAIAAPDICVITNVAKAHCEFFDGIEDIIEAKCELLENLKADATVIVNADYEQLFARARKYKSELIGFGRKKGCRYHASNVIEQRQGVAFSLNNTFTFSLNILGEHNVDNALAAIAVAEHFNIGMDEVRAQLRKLQPAPLRMQPIDCGDIKIIADCYNANPHSAAAAVHVLSSMNYAQRRIFVFADMLELGGLTVDYHASIGRLVANSRIEKLIVTGEHAAHAATAARNCGMAQENVFECANNADTSALLLKMIRPADVVLLKGSRKMRLEEIARALQEALTGKKSLNGADEQKRIHIG